MNSRNRRIFLAAAMWIAVAVLLWLALRGVDWQLVRQVIGGLSAGEVFTLILVNLGIVLLLGARWWLIVRAMGYRVSFLRAAAYRLAAFGVSYFTPGPHFGGEPLQVYLAVRREGIPAGAATASVALDKIFEMCANFAFLAFGVVILLDGGLLGAGWGPIGLALAGGMLALPLVYLFSLTRGSAPLTRFARRTPGHAKWLRSMAGLVEAAEEEAAGFVKAHRATFFRAVILSGIIWSALVLEFKLATNFLGLQLDFRQTISMMAAARIAILLPVPGDIGTLETALILVTQALGERTALGVGLTFVIRARDISFGLLGLALGRRFAVPDMVLTE